jgi:hypothetical protein
MRPSSPMPFRSVLAALGLMTATFSTHAATATPTLSLPANGTSNWLFNSGANFSWSAINGATYRIVVSDSATFANFSESSSSCINSGCVTAQLGTSYATPASLANYWFYGTATYYWRVKAYTSSGGWGAWSTPRSFTTTSTQLRSVVTNALAYAGQASPQSFTGGGWWTDMDIPVGSTIPDFTRYSNAMTTLSSYVASYAGGMNAWINAGRPITTAVRTSMRASLSSYPSVSVKDATIDQMRAVYAGLVPTTYNGMLSLMRIRAQCKEFADRMVMAGGLKRLSYTSTGTSYPRPGMYAFWTPARHAAIIRAVSYSTANTPSAMLIESNWSPDVWENPDGQTPWWRTVIATRIQSLGGTSGYVAVEPPL